MGLRACRRRFWIRTFCPRTVHWPSSVMSPAVTENFWLTAFLKAVLTGPIGASATSQQGETCRSCYFGPNITDRCLSPMAREFFTVLFQHHLPARNLVLGI